MAEPTRSIRVYATDADKLLALRTPARKTYAAVVRHLLNPAPARTLTSVSVAPTHVTRRLAANPADTPPEQLSAYAHYSDGTVEKLNDPALTSVVWESKDKARVLVNTAGQLTFLAPTLALPAYVTATHHSGKVGVCQVRIEPAELPPPPPPTTPPDVCYPVRVGVLFAKNNAWAQANKAKIMAAVQADIAKLGEYVLSGPGACPKVAMDFDIRAIECDKTITEIRGNTTSIDANFFGEAMHKVFPDSEAPAGQPRVRRWIGFVPGASDTGNELDRGGGGYAGGTVDVFTPNTNVGWALLGSWGIYARVMGKGDPECPYGDFCSGPSHGSLIHEFGHASAIDPHEAGHDPAHGGTWSEKQRDDFLRWNADFTRTP